MTCQPGTKRHVVVDRPGIPLAIGLTAANRPDDGLHADKGYDYPHCRATLRRWGLQARIARKGVESKTKLGRYRWVAERTMPWINQLKRLRIRDERLESIHQAWLDLGCILICLRFLQHPR